MDLDKVGKIVFFARNTPAHLEGQNLNYTEKWHQKRIFSLINEIFFLKMAHNYIFIQNQEKSYCPTTSQ